MTLFPIGQLLISVGVTKLISTEEIAQYLSRHTNGDWGNIDPEVGEENNVVAQQKHGTILSSYTLAKQGQEIWLHTDFESNATTVLLPNEYCAIGSDE
ncbi:hypothetical protein Pse7367_0296 [Thalassoporum mexicanum PCC 7367]|uniref:hypothetical protein n=1 Tax=Thalassoporum mexicanum TaxID=3457544 RepID=UPI00029FF406|nr:hypothetical protein [Pseudanabaena sp. PCC 7367]AFY68610.1 hypothetical protein Pse7367_0296 [Pseudanabaena sp. PCC 7367]